MKCDILWHYYILSLSFCKEIDESHLEISKQKTFSQIAVDFNCKHSKGDTCGSTLLALKISPLALPTG